MSYQQLANGADVPAKEKHKLLERHNMQRLLHPITTMTPET